MSFHFRSKLYHNVCLRMVIKYVLRAMSYANIYVHCMYIQHIKIQTDIHIYFTIIFIFVEFR